MRLLRRRPGLPQGIDFRGGSLLHLDTEGATDATVSTFFSSPGSAVKTWSPGWEVAGQYNFTKLLGVKADFSGNYGTPLTVPGESTPSARAYSFLFGPVLSLRGEHATHLCMRYSAATT